MEKIEAPKVCPSCSGPLEWQNHLLYCNNNNCGSRATKRVEHFAKTLKIKGLGPATIEKLEITSIAGIFLLTQEEAQESLGSSKLATKLLEQIEISKTASLNEVLPALSIPLIGKSATEKLSKVCDNLADINEDSCKEAGLGPKATHNLVSWLNYNFTEITTLLPFSFKFQKPISKETKGVVCISGKLKTYKNKALATEALERNGYVVKSSITKDVSILVNESGIESAKTKKATESGIKIVTDLQQFLGEI